MTDDERTKRTRMLRFVQGDDSGYQAVEFAREHLKPAPPARSTLRARQGPLAPSIARRSRARTSRRVVRASTKPSSTGDPEPEPPGRAGGHVTAVVVDEVVQRGDSDARISAVISIVPDIAKLLDPKSRGLHGDVIDALVELVVELLDEETAHGEGQDR